MNMENTLPKASTLSELARRRWSPRAFDGRAVEPEKLEQLFETARWAPSATNAQPWRFVYVTHEQPEAFHRFLESLMDGNKVWARNAPVLLAVFARKHFEHNGKPYTHAWYDTGQAMGMLALQATELGLSVHQMGGFYPEKIARATGVPDEYKPVIMAAIGYAGDPAQLPEPLQTREKSPRMRKEISELVRVSGCNGEAE